MEEVDDVLEFFLEVVDALESEEVTIKITFTSLILVFTFINFSFSSLLMSLRT